MKKFVQKGLLFCVIIALLCACVVYLSTTEHYRSAIAKWTNSSEFMGDGGMVPIFEQARRQDGATQLVLGDSICRQLFSGLSEYNPKTSFLATNAALMITGQYLLVEEYLQTHPDTTDVWLVMHPLALTRTFDTEWSYRYAYMTYVETETLQYLDENTLAAMESVYGGFLMQKWVVQLAEDSPIVRKLCLNHIKFNSEDYIQASPFEIADQYVKKMYELCEENGVKLHVYASPAAEYYRGQIEELSAVYGETWMSSQYPDYFDDMMYYPDEWSEDLSHFSGEYATRDKLNEIIENAYGQTTLLEKLSYTGTNVR
ncbi:MAG: hypothetical protein E7293_04950 [Lachnospiraceae bacterium]|nr:hypothetical protein [Lachnospiraceae bacterium]